MNGKRRGGGIAGVIIFLGVVAVAGGYEYLLTRGNGMVASVSELFADKPTVIEIGGYVGSEKEAFLNNRDVQRILEERYGLAVRFRSAGSFEMLELPTEDIDFLWPSSLGALDRYQDRFGPPLAAETVFHSPIVLYSWTAVVDRLEERGLARWDESVYRADLSELLDLTITGSTWADVGVPDVFGPFALTSTDPERSSSGFMFAGLVLNTLHGGVVTHRTLPDVRADATTVLRAQGPMERSTGTLFDRFLELGMVRYPIIVGYESQYIEFARTNPDLWPDVRRRIVMIYPAPTVWSSHPLIALDERGRRFVEAMADDELLSIAWNRHGFRAGVVRNSNAPRDEVIGGVAEVITQVTRMPEPSVVTELLVALDDAR